MCKIILSLAFKYKNVSFLKCPKGVQNYMAFLKANLCLKANTLPGELALAFQEPARAPDEDQIMETATTPGCVFISVIIFIHITYPLF